MVTRHSENNFIANMKDNVRQDEFIPMTRSIIKNVLEAVGMTAPKFAEALGINYQRIFDLQRGRTKKFNPNIAALICEKFPQINKSYLFTGEGSVLVETEDAVPVEHVPTEPASDGGGLVEISALLHRLVDMLGQVNERSARLADFERQLNEREAALNARELDIEQREDELGMAEKKTV